MFGTGRRRRAQRFVRRISPCPTLIFVVSSIHSLRVWCHRLPCCAVPLSQWFGSADHRACIGDGVPRVSGGSSLLPAILQVHPRHQGVRSKASVFVCASASPTSALNTFRISLLTAVEGAATVRICRNTVRMTFQATAATKMMLDVAGQVHSWPSLV